MGEHANSKSTQPRYSTTIVTLYVNSPHQLVKDFVALGVGVPERVDDALSDLPQRRRHLLRRQDGHLGGRGVRPEFPLMIPLQELAEAHEIRLEEREDILVFTNKSIF